jgi:hypothetical protein
MARQFPIRENQQTYSHPYLGQDFDAGMGAGSYQMPKVGVKGGCYHQGVETVPFASAGTRKDGGFYSLMAQPSVADYAPVSTNTWWNWKSREGNDTAFAYVPPSRVPPGEMTYNTYSSYQPRGEGMGGSFYLVVDNNQGKNVVPL